MILRCWIKACSYACEGLLIVLLLFRNPGTQGPAPDKEAIAESESKSDFDLHQAQTEAQRLFDDFEVLDPSMLLCMQRLTSSQWFCCCSGT